jgi:uncharacterized membrane protein
MGRWRRESARQVLAVAPVPLCLLVPGEVLVKLLAGWDIYAVVYLVLTWLAFRGHEPARLRELVAQTRFRAGRDRWLALPPEQLSQGAASLAMVATVNAMPQARDLGTEPVVVLAVCLLAVISSWLVLQAGFALLYLTMHTEGGGLDFPGDDEPGMTDFLYFAVSVGTTFGTTDVTVTRSRVRRQVLTHAVSAFVFNTLVVAIAVTIATSYLAP